MSAKTPLRVDVTGALKKLGKINNRVKASAFRAILMDYVRKVLTTAGQLTPVRDAQLIRSNQEIQYLHRINYIPSYHELIDPTLIVNDQDEHWIYNQGKWYRGDWKLPDDVWSVYQDLLSERERRMKTPRQQFINQRSQARFLYKKSWWQVGRSIGLEIPVGDAAKSFSRHNPPKEPPKGYAQIRGGKNALSVDIRNPFLEQPSRYKSFTGRSILQRAANVHKRAFDDAMSRAVRKEVRAAQ